jgi:hypothetical protein
MWSWFNNVVYTSPTANPMCNGAQLYVERFLLQNFLIDGEYQTYKDAVERAKNNLFEEGSPHNYKFYGCTSLKSLKFGPGAIIGWQMFAKCPNLLKVTIITSGAYNTIAYGAIPARATISMDCSEDDRRAFENQKLWYSPNGAVDPGVVPQWCDTTLSGSPTFKYKIRV